MVTCLERGSNDLHMVQLMTLPAHHVFALLKSRVVLPFWCWLTQVVLEKEAVKWMFFVNAGSNKHMVIVKIEIYIENCDPI